MSFMEGIGEGCGFFIGKAIVPVIVVVALSCSSAAADRQNVCRSK